MSKTRWLDRRIAAPGPYLTLCLTETAYKDACKHLRVKPDDWVYSGAGATTHHLYNPQGDRVCVVCMRDWEGRTPIEVAGLLIHEAVHVWQEYADSIGERYPGREQEAYAVQCIAQELMHAFVKETTR